MKKPLDISGYRKFVEGLLLGRPAGKPLRSPEARLRATAACALALAVHGYPECYNPEKVGLLGFPRPVPLDMQTIRWLAGGGKAVRRKLLEWLPSEPLAPWTPGFVRGLVMSGALVKLNGGASCWRIVSSKWREGLVKSFRQEGLPAFRVGSQVNWGDSHYVPVGGLWIPGACGGEGSLEELAGVLAGGKAMEAWGYEWLLVKEASLGALNVHGVCYHEWGRKLLVSPFWGVVLGRLMPEPLRSWMGGFRKPGDCPLLPWAVWSACVGKPRRKIPLPYSASRDWLKGRSLKEVREEAVRELELGGMSVELMGEVVKWVH